MGTLVAPWKDAYGSEIFSGSSVVNLSGQKGTVVFIPDRGGEFDNWVIDYGHGIESRLCVGANSEGLAKVRVTK